MPRGQYGQPSMHIGAERGVIRERDDAGDSGRPVLIGAGIAAAVAGVVVLGAMTVSFTGPRRRQGRVAGSPWRSMT